MISLKALPVLSAALLVLGWSAVPARANLLPFLASTSPGSGGTTVFNYSASLSSDERMDGSLSGGYTAFFTIYDFAGYVPGSEFAPAGWTVSVQLVGETPAGLTADDDPTVENLTFTYVGSPTIIGNNQTFTGFGASSIYSDVNVNGFFSQQTTKNAGAAAGGRDFGGGPEETPMAMTGTPEPASLLLLGAGLIAVASAGRKLRR